MIREAIEWLIYVLAEGVAIHAVKAGEGEDLTDLFYNVEDGAPICSGCGSYTLTKPVVKVKGTNQTYHAYCWLSPGEKGLMQ